MVNKHQGRNKNDPILWIKLPFFYLWQRLASKVEAFGYRFLIYI